MPAGGRAAVASAIALLHLTASADAAVALRPAPSPDTWFGHPLRGCSLRFPPASGPVELLPAVTGPFDCANDSTGDAATAAMATALTSDFMIDLRL